MATQHGVLAPLQGVIAAGSDADVILLDPTQPHVISAETHHSAMDTNIYEGRLIRGKVGRPGRQGAMVPAHEHQH